MIFLILLLAYVVNANETCFISNSELRQAVRSYVEDPRPESAVAEKYGWPIGAWCVDKIRDFSNVFTTRRTFNEDVSRWNMSQATSLYRMFDRAERFNQDLSTWGK